MSPSEQETSEDPQSDDVDHLCWGALLHCLDEVHQVAEVNGDGVKLDSVHTLALLIFLDRNEIHMRY